MLNTARARPASGSPARLLDAMLNPVRADPDFRRGSRAIAASDSVSYPVPVAKPGHVRRNENTETPAPAQSRV